MNKREKIVGVLGGKGPEATEMLFSMILKNTHVLREEDHLRIIIDNNPKIPKPSLGITGEGDNPLPALVETARNLEGAGADFIVIPCNSAHFYIKEIRESIAIPVISIISATVATARSSKCKRLGILASTGLIQSGIFQRELHESGIDFVVPNDQDQLNLMREIIRFKDEGEQLRLRNVVASVVEKLAREGADGLILGCTEIPVVFSQKDCTVPCFDTLEILALAAIREARKDLPI